MRLKGKVALITGGGTGIGEAAARVCAAQGAAVVITGRRKEVLDQVVDEITRKDGRALAVAGSVTEEAHVRSAVQQAVDTFGGLDILVNNAAKSGEGLGPRLHETTDQMWNESIDVNLGGIFRFTRATIPHMLDSGGSIINISSIAALVGIPNMAAYCATKGGLMALSRAVAVEYGKEKIRCNCICPGLVDTPRTAAVINDPQLSAFFLPGYSIGRFGTPTDVANLIVYLASEEASWVTGSVISIDGGFTAQ